MLGKEAYSTFAENRNMWVLKSHNPPTTEVFLLSNYILSTNSIYYFKRLGFFVLNSYRKSSSYTIDSKIESVDEEIEDD